MILATKRTAPNHRNPISGRGLLDYALPKALAQSGVTMQLLWEKYVNACRHNDQPYYRLKQFKKYFNDHLNQHSFHLI